VAYERCSRNTGHITPCACDVACCSSVSSATTLRPGTYPVTTAAHMTAALPAIVMAAIYEIVAHCQQTRCSQRPPSSASNHLYGKNTWDCFPVELTLCLQQCTQQQRSQKNPSLGTHPWFPRRRIGWACCCWVWCCGQWEGHACPPTAERGCTPIGFCLRHAP
jgi:hypothetical protein